MRGVYSGGKWIAIACGYDSVNLEDFDERTRRSLVDEYLFAEDEFPMTRYAFVTSGVWGGDITASAFGSATSMANVIALSKKEEMPFWWIAVGSTPDEAVEKVKRHAKAEGCDVGKV